MSIDSYPLEQPQPDYMIVTSTTRPANPYVGLHIFETDTKRMYYWDGSAWARTNNIKYFNSWGALAGATPVYEDAAFKIQSGSNVVATNASGDFTITFPTPFPGGLMMFLVQQGDNTHGGASYVPYLGGASASSQVVRVYNSSGGVWANSGNMRVSWLAIGW